ncbi:hypothetical protein OG21DRAFT_148048 [Imleria badia]|nr:hypothetical protein OG21DRAFT_148048 [Imleria badia]
MVPSVWVRLANPLRRSEGSCHERKKGIIFWKGDQLFDEYNAQNPSNGNQENLGMRFSRCGRAEWTRQRSEGRICTFVSTHVSDYDMKRKSFVAGGLGLVFGKETRARMEGSGAARTLPSMLPADDLHRTDDVNDGDDDHHDNLQTLPVTAVLIPH